MMSAHEKVLHAYAEEALQDLFMGKWPYYESEAYMAPSNVPTNWRSIVMALNGALNELPDLPKKVEDALAAMTTSAEEVYSALQMVLFYCRLRDSLSPNFILDHDGLLAKLGSGAVRLQSEAQASRPSWMGPTDETLWDRIERTAAIITDEVGCTIL